MLVRCRQKAVCWTSGIHFCFATALLLVGLSFWNESMRSRRCRPYACVRFYCVVFVMQADVHVARQGHAAVCHHGRALVFGGVSEGTLFMNDCLA